LPIPQKIYKITKRLRTPDEVEQYFPAGFLAFIDATQSNSRFLDLLTRIEEDVLIWKEKETWNKDTTYG
jgi:hypothetical protein